MAGKEALNMLLQKIIENIPIVDTGAIPPADVAKNSYREVDVKFSKKFQNAPVVSVTLVSTSASGLFGRCNCTISSNPTTTGVKVRIYNGDDSSVRSPAVRWIAIDPKFLVGGGYYNRIVSTVKHLFTGRCVVWQ